MKKIESVRVQRQEKTVYVTINGEHVLCMPWEKADEVASAIRQVARLCEEWQKAEAIAKDQALLIRAGIPLGLTNDPRIQAEAAKHAAWDSELRRALPGGIKSEEQFGTPRLIAAPPKH